MLGARGATPRTGRVHSGAPADEGQQRPAAHRRPGSAAHRSRRRCSTAGSCRWKSGATTSAAPAASTSACRSTSCWSSPRTSIPARLADEAFLRRIGSKISFEPVTREQYRADLGRGVRLTRRRPAQTGVLEFVIHELLRQARTSPVLPCHPRDLLGGWRSISRAIAGGHRDDHRGNGAMGLGQLLSSPGRRPKSKERKMMRRGPILIVLSLRARVWRGVGRQPLATASHRDCT